MLLATMVGGMTFTTVSCSSDDDDKPALNEDAVVNIEQGLKANGVTATKDAEQQEVEIKSDGQWVAVLPKGENGVKWVKILNAKIIYEGNQKLTLQFDENLTGADRVTELTIADAQGEITKIPVRQRGGDANASGDSFAEKGLGCGFKYDYVLNTKSNADESKRIAEENAEIEKWNKANPNNKRDLLKQPHFDPTKVRTNNNVFNFTEINRLQELKDPLLKLAQSAYREEALNIADLQASMLDSACVQSKHLDVSLKIGLELGVISFTAEGKYAADVKEGRAHVDYTISRNAPLFNVYVAPADIRQYAASHKKADEVSEEAEYARIDAQIAAWARQNQKRHKKNLDDDGLTPEQAEMIEEMYDNMKVRYDFANVYSPNFADCYSQLYNAFYTVTGKKRATPDYETAEFIVKQLNNDYGPFIIAGGEFGGSMIINCRVDTLMNDGTVTVGGSLSAEMAGGLFDVSGEFNYTSEGFNVMHNYKTNFYIYGGKANETADKLLAIVTSDNPADRKQWRECLTGWVDSMKDPEDTEHGSISAASPLSYEATPIWQLFYEPEIQEYVKQWFIKEYSNRTPALSTYLGVAETGKALDVKKAVNGDLK
jgi:hypothetical protein